MENQVKIETILIRYRNKSLVFSKDFNPNVKETTIAQLRKIKTPKATLTVNGETAELFQNEGLYFLIINNRVYNQI